MENRNLQRAINESLKNIWSFLLPVDVSKGMILHETAMKLAIYHYLRLQLETRFPCNDNFRILTELDMHNSRIDLVIADIPLDIEPKSVQGHHLRAGIELKFIRSNCTEQAFKKRADESEKYAKEWQYNECRHYILVLMSDLLFSETVVLDWLHAPVIDDEGHIQPVTKMVSYVVDDQREWSNDTKLMNFFSV